MYPMALVVGSVSKRLEMRKGGGWVAVTEGAVTANHSSKTATQ